MQVLIPTSHGLEVIPDGHLHTLKFAPEPRFIGRSLRDVLDAHLELAARDTHDPFYFLVAIHRDWEKKGVLVVGRDYDNHNTDSCRIDAFRAVPRDAGIAIVNLQIANMSWNEEKDYCRLKLKDEDEDQEPDDDSCEAHNA